MAKKITGFKTKGMNRDLSASAFDANFSFENYNLRLSTNENNTMLSWVNEKGTAPILDSVSGNQVEIPGTPIGTAVLNDWLVVFSTDYTSGTRTSEMKDYIHRLNYNTNKTRMIVTKLFEGNLNFCTKNPIETQVSYESENIQKVYWVDGRNQPRLINVVGTIDSTDTTQFDFIPTLALKETVKVKKMLGTTGAFAPGVIQYCFTYFRKNGQQSNIFYTTPLYYISHRDRGASPDDKVNNSFKITVSGLDHNFNYLRIYSIQRTSINSTPLVKRLQDIEIDSSINTVSYIDTGSHGDSMDPTELLYLGGETVIASTLTQKDNTLFLGDLKLSRPYIESSLETTIKRNTEISESTRSFVAETISTGSYAYANQLTSNTIGIASETCSVPCSGFKTMDYYRLGVQFQYKTGKWSDPVFLDDYQMSEEHRPTEVAGKITLPIFKGVINSTLATNLRNKGYRRVRGVAVFPDIQDRTVVCQGVVCPTVYTKKQREDDKSLYAQPSWFFRPGVIPSTPYMLNSGAVRPYGGSDKLRYQNIDASAEKIREVEIQGYFEDDNKFTTDVNFVTFHSPEIEFNENMYLLDYSNVTAQNIGTVQFTHTFSDIDIQLETPTASAAGSGFIHKSFSQEGCYGIVSGLFYDDYCVDEDGSIIEPYDQQRSSYKWMVYPWQADGSLNNDINRPADKGTPTGVLKKKVISNLRYAKTTWSPTSTITSIDLAPKVFYGDEISILKFNNAQISDALYMGNINTILIPDKQDGLYFAFGYMNDERPPIYVEDPQDAVKPNQVTPFDCKIKWKTYANLGDEGDEYKDYGLWYYVASDNPPVWERRSPKNHVGNKYMDLVLRKGFVRMKYKSTPHLAFKGNINGWTEDGLPIVEFRQTVDETTRFGGTSMDALRENVWIPCGESVELNGTTTYYYNYGDTYYQRYDCLKTYCFTREDVNQIVEIGSFMLETHINIDGRYDKNRGQMNNLNMHPINFNLYNSVYSQIDNFFTYRIQDSDYYKENTFNNQITWSKTKISGADVDLWTNVTLAAMLELDGNCGKLNKLEKLNDSIIAFQDSGISQILYNENAALSTTDGVPIELGNSGKVDGERYISDTIGCSNKWSIATTPVGIYFIDSHEKSIYLFNGQFSNLSINGGMNVWSKQTIPSSDTKWNPVTFADYRTVYDRINQDVMFITKTKAVAWSEKLTSFTSFYDYQNTPYFNNFDDSGVWIDRNGKLWKHNSGNYCNFFGVQKPYYTILIGNPEPQVDKIFTNLEMAVNIDGEGIEESPLYIPYLPFSSLETWNEYQHGITNLLNLTGLDATKHFIGNNNNSLKRKYRLWRCDIPRDNASTGTIASPFSTDDALGIKRFKAHPIDRMRNTWLYMKLYQNTDNSNKRTEIHDVLMTYYS